MGSTDGTGEEARFTAIKGIVNDGAGLLYVLDDTLIRVVNVSSGEVTTLVPASSAALLGAEGPSGSPAFTSPKGLVYDNNCQLFVTHTNDAFVQVLTITGCTPSPLGDPQCSRFYPTPTPSSTYSPTLTASRSATPTPTVTYVPPPNATLFSASAMEYDGRSQLYVTNNNGRTVQSFDVGTGIVSEMWGNGEAQILDGYYRAASFNGVVSIRKNYNYLDGNCIIYVIDGAHESKNYLRVINAATGYVSTSDSQTYTPQGAAVAWGNTLGAFAPHNSPSDYPNVMDGFVLQTGSGKEWIYSCYVLGPTAESWCTRYFTYDLPSGSTPAGLTYYNRNLYYSLYGKAIYWLDSFSASTKTLLAGSTSVAGSTDGTGTAARFTAIKDIANAGNGLLYVLDGSIIRVVHIASKNVTTFVPSSTNVLRGEGGPAGTPSFNSPKGIIYDMNCHLFVSHTNDAVVQVLSVTGCVPMNLTASNCGPFIPSTTPTASPSPVSPSNFATTTPTASVYPSTPAYPAGLTQVTSFPAEVDVRALNNATLDGAGAMEYDDHGGLYISNGNGTLVTVFDVGTGIVSAVYGSGQAGAMVDGYGTSARFDGIVSIRKNFNYFYENCILYVIDGANAVSSKLRVINAATGYVSTADSQTYTPQGVPVPWYQLGAIAPHNNAGDYPNVFEGYVLMTGTGNEWILTCYLLDNFGAASCTKYYTYDLPSGSIPRGLTYCNRKIYYSLYGTEIHARDHGKIAGNRNIVGAKDGVGSNARFKKITAIVNDGAGSLYVLDDNTLRVVSLQYGIVSTVVGNVSTAATYQDGPGLLTSLEQPQGLVFDFNCHIFISDSGANMIRVVTLDGCTPAPITPPLCSRFVPSPTVTVSPTPSVSPSLSATRTKSPSNSATRTMSRSKSVARTVSPSNSPSSSVSPSNSASLTSSPTNSATNTASVTPTPSVTPTITISPTNSPSSTTSPTLTSSSSETSSPSPKPPQESPKRSGTASATPTASATATGSITGSVQPTRKATRSPPPPIKAALKVVSLAPIIVTNETLGTLQATIACALKLPPYAVTVTKAAVSDTSGLVQTISFSPNAALFASALSADCKALLGFARRLREEAAAAAALKGRQAAVVYTLSIDFFIIPPSSEEMGNTTFTLTTSDAIVAALTNSSSFTGAALDIFAGSISLGVYPTDTDTTLSGGSGKTYSTAAIAGGVVGAVVAIAIALYIAVIVLPASSKAKLAADAAAAATAASTSKAPPTATNLNAVVPTKETRPAITVTIPSVKPVAI